MTSSAAPSSPRPSRRSRPPTPRDGPYRAVRDGRRSLWAGALVGVGVMASLDELLFHQILGWHHFYDRSTPAVGLMSDGFLHAAELIALVTGFFLLMGLQRHRQLARPFAIAGFFIGAGGFQLFDGIVDHKVLRLHQIRYGVELLPYDLAWNLGAIALLVLGFLLLRRARRAGVLASNDSEGAE